MADMTVYEYIRSLPQPLFEATLLGLMGFPLNPEKEAWFHEWMNRPYSEIFPLSNPSETAGDIMVPVGYLTVLLGKTASTLPPEKQKQLRDAMKNYCEVCDFANDRLAEQQKASDIKGE